VTKNNPQALPFLRPRHRRDGMTVFPSLPL
jgi:hypothetical protein